MDALFDENEENNDSNNGKSNPVTFSSLLNASKDSSNGEENQKYNSIFIDETDSE